jgi:ABC-type glycerol-3-phosphate transport system substrate-binding protein
MKLYECSSIALVIIVVALLAGMASGHWLSDDNEIEEISEEIIEYHTGIEIDLTPESQE